MKKIALISYILLFSSNIFSQNIIGKVTNINNIPIENVNISTKNGIGCSTDNQGNYILNLSKGNHIISFQHVSFSKQDISVKLSKGEKKTLNVILLEKTNMLSDVEIDSKKEDHNISQMLSLDVINEDFFLEKANTDVSVIINQISGLTLNDKQVHIRGGSGWNPMAGSRVLFLIDDNPLLTGNMGQIPWDLIPMENIEEIEIIKGASSSIYGSSALNGVVNIKTKSANQKKIDKHPSQGYTQVNSLYGYYDSPNRKELVWWEGKNEFINFDVLHTEIFDNTSIFLSGNYFKDDGYRMGQNVIRKRISSNIRHHSQKINGLELGINGTYMQKEDGMFCDTTGAPQGGSPNLRWLGDDSTDYYDDYTIKSDNGWDELLDFIYTLNYNFNEIDSVLNVDRVLWAFAVNAAISNLDTYNGYYIHNYYLYQTKDGLFQMIPWDLDNSFLGAILGFTNPTTLYERDPYYCGSAGERPLAYNLLNDPFYRKIYTAHLRTVVNSLDTAVIRNDINQLQSLAHNAVDSDQYRQYTTTEYYSNVEDHLGAWWRNGGIMVTIDERKEYLLSHPEISLISPTINNIMVNNNLVEANVFNASSVELMITASQYNSKFQSFAMNDDGINGDLTPNDGIYSIQLPFVGNTNVKFYIRAQNNDAMTLSPERAEYEFYEYSTISGFADSQIFNKRTLLKVCDVLGKESGMIYNQPLFFIYSDGTVEKKIIIE